MTGFRHVEVMGLKNTASMFNRPWQQAKDTSSEKNCWREGQKNKIEAGGKFEVRKCFFSDMRNYSTFAY